MIDRIRPIQGTGHSHADYYTKALEDREDREERNEEQRPGETPLPPETAPVSQAQRLVQRRLPFDGPESLQYPCGDSPRRR